LISQAGDYATFKFQPVLRRHRDRMVRMDRKRKSRWKEAVRRPKSPSAAFRLLSTTKYQRALSVNYYGRSIEPTQRIARRSRSRKPST
jgi:hypothetical protein